jgi:hypothetical protein
VTSGNFSDDVEPGFYSGTKREQSHLEHLRKDIGHWRTEHRRVAKTLFFALERRVVGDSVAGGL